MVDRKVNGLSSGVDLRVESLQSLRLWLCLRLLSLRPLQGDLSSSRLQRWPDCSSLDLDLDLPLDLDLSREECLRPHVS